MATIIMVVLFACAPRAASAATYYVDATDGKDPHPGTLISGTTWTSGVSGGGASFDGSDDIVSLDASTDLRPAQWTVAAWVNATSGASNYRGIFLPPYADGYLSGYFLFIDNGGRAAIRYGNGTNYVNAINSGTSILGAWHHVAATFDGGSIRLYVDGVEKNSMNASTFAYMSTPTMARLGFGDGTSTFQGDMDDFRLYDRMLSGTEVSDLHTGAVPSSGLVAWLPFSEGSGTATADASGNDGTSASTPWKTLGRVSTASLQPGDSVLLARGEMWREGLTIPTSGTTGNPVTFGAYGSGAKPIINAAQHITGWTQHSGDIYVADVGFSVTQLFIDGEYADVAHYPASGYLDISEDSTDGTYLVDPDLTLTSGEVVGSDIRVRTVPWYLETKTVTGYDEGTHRVSWSGSTTYNPQANYGYYLTNKLWMLDQPNEWHYDSSAGKLYLMLENGDDPDAHLVEASYVADGIVASWKDHFVIEDIDVRYAKSNGISLTNVSDATVRRSSVSSSASHGVSVQGSAATGIDIEDSEFSENILTGIFLSDTTDATVSGNEIFDTAADGQPKRTQAAIHSYQTTNLLVEDNVVSRSGYIGILYSGTGNIIRNNTVDDVCLVFDDCAGIYTWGDYGDDNEVVGNIISDAIGNNAGTEYNISQAEGIYLDDRSHGMTVTGNTITNAEHGIFLHNSYENTVTGNTVYRSRNSALWIKEDSIIGISGFIHDNVITGNVFHSVSDTYPAAKFDGFLGSVDFGTYDENFYTNPYAESTISQTVGSTPTEYTLSEWQSVSGQDGNSEDLSLVYEAIPYEVTGIIGSNLVANGSFDSDNASWYAWAADSSASVSWSASCGLDGGCLSAHTDAASSIVNSATFPIESGKTYRVSWSAIAPETETGTIIIRKGAANWNEYARKYFSVGAIRSDDSFAFTSTVTIPNARIDFVTDAADTNYSLDNVVIREVTAEFNDAADDAAIYTNPTSSASVVSLGSARFCGLDNRDIGGSFSLPAFGSRVLLSCFDNVDGECNNHETHGTAPDECEGVDEEGPYAGLDAPYTMGTHHPNVSGETRVYAGGKYRYRAAASGETAHLSISPVGGFSGSETDRWMDLSIDEWETSGDRFKRWTESSDTIGNTVTEHLIGDLIPGYRYAVSVDDAVGSSVSGSECDAGICTADGNGRIAFSYSGGYSTHTFEVAYHDSGPSVVSGSGDDGDDGGDDDGSDSDALEITKLRAEPGAYSVTLTWETDRKADTRARYGVSLDDLRYEARDPERVRDHRIVIGQLAPSTTYYFRVRSRDGDGNIDSDPYIVATTLPAGVEVVSNSGNGEGSVETPSPSSGNATYGPRPSAGTDAQTDASGNDGSTPETTEENTSSGIFPRHVRWIGIGVFLSLVLFTVIVRYRRSRN